MTYEFNELINMYIYYYHKKLKKSHNLAPSQKVVKYIYTCEKLYILNKQQSRRAAVVIFVFS